MFIAIALICTGGGEVAPDCNMYMWPSSFVTTELCDSFAASNLHSETPIGFIAHVGCFNLKDLDEPA